MINSTLRRFIPESVINRVKNLQRERMQAKVRSLPELSADEMREILTDRMNISSGDLVFVHSSVDRLHLGFPFFQILGMLREIVGPDGTLVFPTYPPLSSYRYLQTGEVFDVRNTPSYTGILSEFARRQRKGIRSLHPTKSVVAIGPLAQALTEDHHLSPYPYDVTSPYYRTIENHGRVVGIGVGTFNLSLVHSVDDLCRGNFPVQPYHKRLFEAECIDAVGKRQIVQTFAHDMRKMDFDIPDFIANHVDSEIAGDFEVKGMKFFSAYSHELFTRMMDLAADDITIYRHKHYSR